jgi:hypothetical protein
VDLLAAVACPSSRSSGFYPDKLVRGADVDAEVTGEFFMCNRGEVDTYRPAADHWGFRHGSEEENNTRFRLVTALHARLGYAPAAKTRLYVARSRSHRGAPWRRQHPRLRAVSPLFGSIREKPLCEEVAHRFAGEG